MAGPGAPSPWPAASSAGDARRAAEAAATAPAPLRLSVKLTSRALRRAAVGGRRVLVEAHQMRARPAGCRRRSPRPLRRRWPRTRPAPGVRRVGGAVVRGAGGASVGFFASGRTTFGFTGVGLSSGTGLAGSVAGFISTFCSGGATTSGFSCGGVGAICSCTASAARRLRRRGIGLLHHGSRREIHRRRLRRGRNRRHVHHDRRQGNAGHRPLACTSSCQSRSSAACAATIADGRRSPAPDDGLVGDIVQRERVHGASCGRRGRPARS